jgi:hypothetical protein
MASWTLTAQWAAVGLCDEFRQLLWWKCRRLQSLRMHRYTATVIAIATVAPVLC